MKTDWLKTRQTKYTGYITVYILIVLGVLGAANFLANRHNKAFDTTSNKRYSLSDQTEKVVKNLKQDVKVTLYDQTSRFAPARDLLDRYDNLSTKLTVDYIDPDKKPQIARAAGIRSLGTIQVETGGKKEEARSLTEEEITGALIRALKTGERTVCAVSGSGEHGFDDSDRKGYSAVKDALEKNNYKTKTISLLEKAEVPKECTILLVAGPRFDYLDPAVKAVKSYVEGGGRTMVFLNPPLKFGREEIQENAALAKTLEGWGVTFHKDLALDTSGVGQLFGLNEVVPLVTNYESHAIVREMKRVATAFPLTRTLEVKSVDKASAEKLFSTSDESYATTNLASAEIRINRAKDKKGPLALGAAMTYTTGQQGQQGRLVAVGSSEWAANGFIRFNGNRDLFLNMANWLSSDEDLISIRPKDPEDRRISLNRGQMTMVFYSSVLILPLLILAAGVSVWWRRR